MPQSPQEVAYDVALRRLDSRLQDVNVIQNKVGIVLGIAGTGMAIFAGFAAVVVEPDEPVSVVFAGIVGALILLVYLLAMKSGLEAFATGDWDVRPNWRELLSTASEADLPTMHLWVAEGCVLSLTENEPKVREIAEEAARTTRLALSNAVLIAVGLIGLFVVNGIVG